LATVYSLLYRRSLGRKKKLLQRYQDRVPIRETSGIDAEPLHWLLSEERRALVREATALLSDDERLVLTLKYAEERSYKEIAEEIGATVSAVQSKLYRARARLREKLAELAPTANAPPV
jgi:RNA polymerase sigma-70 factor (ECF subfamily)